MVPVHPDRNGFAHSPSFQQRDHPDSILKTFRLLLEPRFAFGKGKLFVNLPDEAGVPDAMNGGHEVPNLPRVVDGIDLPCGFIGFLLYVLRHPDKMTAEIVGKKENLLQQEEIRFDVEETKGHGSSIQGFKSKRHEKSLHKCTFDRSPRGLYIERLMIIFEAYVLRRKFFLKGEASYTKE